MRDGAGFANEIIESDASTNQHPVFNHLVWDASGSNGRDEALKSVLIIEAPQHIGFSSNRKILSDPISLQHCIPQYLMSAGLILLMMPEVALISAFI